MTTALPDVRYPDLAGRVAIVTGGSKGIGAATCRHFARNGMRVAVVARGKEAVDALVEELKVVAAEAVGVPADCTSLAELESMVAQVEDRLGPPDVLAAFAGGFLGRTPLLEISEHEWRSVVDSNLTGTFLTLKAVLPGMVARGRGSVVTMSSISGRVLNLPLTASYAAAKAAAKAGVGMLTRYAAIELGPSGVRLNVVDPATTLSDRVKANLDAAALEGLAARTPIRRVGEPDDTAASPAFSLLMSLHG